MSLYKQIIEQVEENVEVITKKRFNGSDPVIKLKKSDSLEKTIVDIITAERTGTILIINDEKVNPAEDQAKDLLWRGISKLNHWRFSESDNYFVEAAKIARSPIRQQKINLYKQLLTLLQAFLLSSSPERILRTQKSFIEKIQDSLTKYDTLDAKEKDYYRGLLDKLYEIGKGLGDMDPALWSQYFLARSAISLNNKEYLAAYLWQYKLILLNENQLKSLRAKDSTLDEALTNLEQYLNHETKLGTQLEAPPTIASSFDLQKILVDCLKEVYKEDLLLTAKESFSFQPYRK
jgi:hypothetical protein